jgi:branched-chain amino acid transport system permease protein
MAGFAGALYAYFNHFVSPESLAWHKSGEALIMAIIGGASFLYGPPIGAAIFVVLQNYISTYTERWPIIMGVLFIALVLTRRGGVADVLNLLWRKLTGADRKESATETTPTVQSGVSKEGSGE